MVSALAIRAQMNSRKRPELRLVATPESGGEVTLGSALGF